MNGYFSWIGGKKALREEVVRRFPLEVPRYIEVFGGAGWVFFHKDPSPFEVYNDYNRHLSNLFHCVQEEPEALIAQLRYAINSRNEFERICDALDQELPATLVKRAAWFYQRLRFSYAAGLKSYACQPHDLWTDFPLIRNANRRLKDTIVENQDFERLIRHYDQPDSLFYCDPPYHGTEDYYQNLGKEGFTERDHIRLRDTLLTIQGKFLLSYNDDSFVRQMYAAPGIQIEPVTRLNNLRQRYETGSQFPELLIANYDMTQRRKAGEQLALF